MTVVHLNRVATAVPEFDVHQKFVAFAPELLTDERSRRLFRRMAERTQIEHRYSFVEPDPSPRLLDRIGLFKRGNFPSTAERMRFFAENAVTLAGSAVAGLGSAAEASRITHLIVTTCTGFYAPGLDLQLIDRFGLRPGIERTMIGFMGCQAALPAMKLARHIVRSQPDARVLMVNLELCTLHLQETSDLQSVLSFLIFADGCAASVISAEQSGLEIHGFGSMVLPDSGEQITWRIGDLGFLMWLDGAVPATIARGLPRGVDALLGGCEVGEVGLWAVHPGGRSILDAVQEGLRLDEEALAPSRAVLRDYGNMSSATIMFVLAGLMELQGPPRTGCALAFGPGLTAEAMRFRTVGHG